MSAPLPAPLPVPAPIAAPAPAPTAAPPSVAHALMAIVTSPSPTVVVMMRFVSIASSCPYDGTDARNIRQRSSAGFGGAIEWSRGRQPPSAVREGRRKGDEVPSELLGSQNDAGERAEVGASGALHVGNRD